ncbi:MAG: signal recognition particle-docking protein FtsY [Christensenellales bacterium]|jgi:fused signal recognition particle receptor|nr:signal recognition particle-docking protein FtsY [Eubacteriales bacterium]
MSIFKKIADALKKTRDNLSQKLYMVFSARKLDEDFYSELEFALISADIGPDTVATIIEEFKKEIFNRRLKEPAEAKELLKEIMLSEIDFEIEEYTYPLVLLISGVNGVGKTTAIGKLANIFKNQGKSVVVAAADTFRAAASEQLEIWAERAGVRIVKHGEGSDPAAVVFDALASAKARGTDVVLVDTAGRLHNKKNLMEELKKINRLILREMPDADYRKFIVLDATTGQNAVAQVDIFGEAIDVDGIILTKLDGTAKGGVVFTISSEKGIPVVYAGVGEKIDDLLAFDASAFIESIF